MNETRELPYGLTHHYTDTITDTLTSYLNNPDLHLLLTTYTNWDRNITLPTILAATEHWDTRKNDTRLHTHYPSSNEPELVTHLLPSFHMTPSQPPLSTYDATIVLGAYTTGMIRRHKHLLALHRHHTLTSTTPIIALTSHRPSEPHETVLLPQLAHPAEKHNETTLAQHIITDLYTTAPWKTHSPHPTENIPHYLTTSTTAATITHQHPSTPIILLPLTQHPANTYATLTHFRNTLYPHLPRPASRPARLLIITTSIYVPYQHLETLRAFHGEHITITTCGADPGNNIHTAPHALLQEIRATLQAYTRLLNTPG